MISRLIFVLLGLSQLRFVAANEARDDEPKIVQDIRRQLPPDWECRFEPGWDTKYVPAGLHIPYFVVVITNQKVVIHTHHHPTRGPLEKKPVIPLCFYKITEKPAVLRIIEEQRVFSWSIPTYFGETESHIVVTSPAWVNGGRYSFESRNSIRAPVTLLQTFIPDKEDQSFARTLLSDRPDTVEVRFNKRDYAIPEVEQAFTEDFGNAASRRLTLPGERLLKPIIVTPNVSTSFAEPWEVLARYMQAAHTGSVEAVLPLYDEPSQQAILALPPGDVSKALESVGQLDSYEFRLLTYRDDFVVAYGYEVQADRKSLTHVIFRRIGTEYRMIAGAPPFSFAYHPALMNFLAEQGFREVFGHVRE